MPFDETLPAGIDCDWLFRNLEEHRDIDGHFLPVASTYHGMHASQIVSNHRDTQIEVAYGHVRTLHSNYMDLDEEKDRDTLMKLMEFSECSSADLQSIYDYIFRLFTCDQDSEFLLYVREYLLRRANEFHLKSASVKQPAPVITVSPPSYNFIDDKWWKRTRPMRKLSNRIRKLRGKQPKVWPDLEGG